MKRALNDDIVVIDEDELPINNPPPSKKQRESSPVIIADDDEDDEIIIGDDQPPGGRSFPRPSGPPRNAAGERATPPRPAQDDADVVIADEEEEECIIADDEEGPPVAKEPAPPISDTNRLLAQLRLEREQRLKKRPPPPSSATTTHTPTPTAAASTVGPSAHRPTFPPSQPPPRETTSAAIAQRTAEGAGAGPGSASSNGRLKLLTWNIWFGEPHRATRFEAILRLIGEERPHVVCLQEVIPEFVYQLASAPWIDHYKVSPPPMGAAYFTMLLVDKALTVRGNDFLDAPFANSVMGRSLLSIRLRLPPSPSRPGIQGPFLVAGTSHLESPCVDPATGKFSFFNAPRQAQLRQSLQSLQSTALAGGGAAVLAGDLNWCEREGDGNMQGYFPALPPTQTLAGGAPPPPPWVDVWPHLRPADPGFTFDKQLNPTVQTRKNLRTRLDRILVFRGGRGEGLLVPKGVRMVGTEPIKSIGLCPSDHFGVLAEFEY